jgi:hypothetical protein
MPASPQEDWQRTANAVGLGLGLASVGFSVSQVTKRPEVALAGIVLGSILTAAMWRRRER